MGFIDYQGNKEDIYDELLEYTADLRKEQLKRESDEIVGNWIRTVLPDADYSQLGIRELLKFIIYQYREIKKIWNAVCADEKEEVDISGIWNDFCIYTISDRLDVLDLSSENKNNYYQTFLFKVFGLSNYTTAKEHYDGMVNSLDYKKYFNACFELDGEGHFWKMIGRCMQGVPDRLNDFVDGYQRLIIYLGYYMYLSFYPYDSAWMDLISREINALHMIKQNYEQGHLSDPDYKILRNPMYI